MKAAVNWRGRYEALAINLLDAAPSARPLLAGFNAFVDAVYPVNAAILERLQAEARKGEGTASPGPRLAAEIISRVGEGRGGALCLNWPSGPAWACGLFGEPAVLQLGGTGPQAAWALAILGAPAIVALTDRSEEQLSVLPPGVKLCDAGRLVEARDLSDRHPPRKPRNIVLELTEGTPWSGGRVFRSTRIMLRFRDSGIERDALFASEAVALASKASACLVAGLDALPEDDFESVAWLQSLIRALKSNGLAIVHLELGECRQVGRLEELCVAFRGIADSVGMSLSELRLLTGRDDRPIVDARDIAARHGLERVFVHADHWSLAVHRGDPSPQEAALMAGNLLASARAHHGQPSRDLAIGLDAEFREDVPPSEILDGEWRADCVPAPYLRRPKATVGLGDTFVAGLLLAAGIPGLNAGT